VPVVILGATRIGLVTVKQLRHSRRYALVACAAVAAFLPGDAITLILETVPLYVLYEASILVAAFAGRRAAAAARGEGGSQASPAPFPDDASEPTVQQIIDHVDPDHTS
jgi:sec-independent protein translocase protein TatC